MAQFIECDFYNHHEHADGSLFFMQGCCRKSCLNIGTIKEFCECEMPMSNYPDKTKIVDGTRLLLNDGTLVYVAMSYEKFKKMIKLEEIVSNPENRRYYEVEEAKQPLNQTTQAEDNLPF